MKNALILATLLFTTCTFAAVSTEIGGIRLTAGGSMRMHFDTKSTFTGQGLQAGTDKRLYNLNDPVANLGNEYDNWIVNKLLMADDGQSFTIATANGGVAQMSHESISEYADLMALDLDVAFPLYTNNAFALYLGVGLSYMPEQTVMDGRAPGSFTQSVTSTKYTGDNLKKYMEDDKYYGKDPKGGFVGNIATANTGVTMDQTIRGDRITSELEASEIRLMLQPEYTWQWLTLGLRMGGAFGYVSSETRAGLKSMLNQVTTDLRYRGDENKAYAQLLLGASASVAITDSLSITAFVDARLFGPTISSEAGPYNVETEMDHYAVGLSLDYTF